MPLGSSNAGETEAHRFNNRGQSRGASPKATRPLAGRRRDRGLPSTLDVAMETDRPALRALALQGYVHTYPLPPASRIFSTSCSPSNKPPLGPACSLFSARKLEGSKSPPPAPAVPHAPVLIAPRRDVNLQLPTVVHHSRAARDAVGLSCAE